MSMSEAQHVDQAYDLLVSKFSKNYNIKSNKYLPALLKALSTGDGYIATEIEAVRDNLIAVTAVGAYLDRAASRYGIVRGQGTGVLDADFQRLIPVLGLSPKQISHILLQVIDTIYGPFASHANVTAALPEPYHLLPGMALNIRVDDTTLHIAFDNTDAVDLTNASAQELSTAISKKTQGKLIGSVVSEARTGENFINIRTSTIGSQGFVQVIGGDAQNKIQFPEIRPVTEAISTWSVSRYLGTDEMIYMVTAGPIPNFLAAGVIKGDFCTIRDDSGFNAKNSGTFPVTFVGSNYFRVQNGSGIPETLVTQNHIDDFLFYKPNLANVLLSSRPAALIETSPRQLTVILPVTSPIVKRTIRGGHHFHQGLTSVLSTTSNTVTIASTTGFADNGAFAPNLARNLSKGIISSVLSNTVTLINAQNFPNQGAFWAPNIRQFFYYSGLSGNTLTGVVPAPPSNLAGITIDYVQRFSYTTITGNVLNGVYPNPTGIENQEINSCGAITGTNFPGSFMYDLTAQFIMSEDVTTTSETIRQGSVKTFLQVDDVSTFPDQGFFVLEFGTESQQGPIRYLAKVGTKALIVDPGHVFEQDHLAGVGLRLVRQIGPYIPRINGQDLAVYPTSTSPARDLLKQYLQAIAASGVQLRFIIRLPEEKWQVLPNLFTTNPLDVSLV